MLRSPFFVSLALAGLASSALSQAPVLAKSGGVLGGTTTVSIEGTPGELYLIVGALEEVSTPLPTGAVLDVALGFLPTILTLPGFLGILDASGQGAGSFSLANDVSLSDLVLSFQAIQGPLFDEASNLVRVTPQAVNSFRPTLEDAFLPTFGGAVTTLDDGRTFIAGTSAAAFQSYDQLTETFQLEAPLVGGGLFSTVTPMADGRLFVAGGLGVNGQPTTSAGTFDPATGVATAVPLGTPRAGHAASLLGDGRVLISGGLSAFDLTDLLGTITGILNTTEIFDPTTNTLLPGPIMTEARAFHTSSRLGNGGAVVAGGIAILPIINLPTVSNTSYTFNAQTNTFSFLPTTFTTGRLFHSATTLADGRVAIAGGLSIDLTTFLQTMDPADFVVGSLDDVQIFSAGGLFGGSWTGAGSMGSARAGAGMVGVPDGGALIAGGFTLSLGGTSPINALGSSAADRLGEGALGVTALGDLDETRILPLCTPLDDGTVLVVGGGPLSATIWQP